MSTTQLNARLNCDLKTAGDAALSQIGFSPTQAVRALWEKAARRGEDLEQVEQLLSSASRETAHDAQANPDDIVREGWALIDEARAALGIGASEARELPSDDELLADALYDRMAERGLA